MSENQNLPDQSAGWGEHRMLVLQSLERLHSDQGAMRAETREAIDAIRKDIERFRDTEVASLRRQVSELAVNVGMLNVKAGLLGAICGTAGSAIVGLIFAAKK